MKELLIGLFIVFLFIFVCIIVVELKETQKEFKECKFILENQKEYNYKYPNITCSFSDDETRCGIIS